MILQALYQLGEKEGLLSDPDFEPVRVAWLVRLAPGGVLAGFQSTQYIPPDSKGENPKPVAKYFNMPRERARTSGERAFFLFDKAEYIFGLDPDNKRPKDKLKKRFNLFRERVKECLQSVPDEGVKALDGFLYDLASGRRELILPEGCKGNDLFTFIYEPDIDQLMVWRPMVRDYWISLRRKEQGRLENKQCLVTGGAGPAAELFPTIKQVPGGTTSGVALVSFNAPAYESHGWSQNENAPISSAAAEGIGDALKRLLYSSYPDPGDPETTLPRRNLRIGGSNVICYWSPDPGGDALCDEFGDAIEADPSQVERLYKSVFKGRESSLDDHPSAFYVLTVSGSQGRAVIRDWIESTVEAVSKNLVSHFNDIHIVYNTPPSKKFDLPPRAPLSLLVESLAVHGDREQVIAPWIGRMLGAALKGEAYPLAFLERAMERYRAEIGRIRDQKHGWRAMRLNDARAALIKAVLNRRRAIGGKTWNYKEVRPDMDPNNHDIGYVLGQLMAVLEKLQQERPGKRQRQYCR